MRSGPGQTCPGSGVAGVGLLAATLAVGLAGGLSGCSSTKAMSQPEYQTCPCQAGAVCCASGVCAASEDACGAATAALSLANRGTWTGYVENFSFISGADELRLTIDVDASGEVTGTVTLGGGAASAATNPDVGWPAGYMYGAHAGMEYVEGYAYPASEVRWQSLRLRMQVATNEAWRDWCALQTPYFYSEGNRYSCLPLQSSVSLSPPCQILGDGGAPVANVDCGKLALCAEDVCACTGGGCTATLQDANVFLDVSLDGDRGDGSIRMGAAGWVNSRVYNVRLTRTSNDVPVPSTPDAGARDTGNIATDAAPDCRATESDAAAYCAPTYDEQIQKASARCEMPGGEFYSGTGTCGAYLYYRTPIVTWAGYSCVYDPDSKALVGFQWSNDAVGPNLCARRTFGTVIDGCGVTFGSGSAGPAVCPR